MDIGLNKIFYTLCIMLFGLTFSCKPLQPENILTSSNNALVPSPVFIGTYTKQEGHVDGRGEGIYLIYQNPVTGELQGGKTVANITNPSFVKASEDKKFLYAVSELGQNDGNSAYIHSFKINPDHSLTETGKLSTESFSPCYIAEDNSGKFIFVANYVGGVVMMYRKNYDGTLAKAQKLTLENPQKSHPHSVTLSADNNTVYITDLGNDKIWIFEFDSEEGTLKPHPQPYAQLKEGAGPRHFAISKSGNFAYSINEKNSRVSVFKVKAEGGLEEILNLSSLPADFNKKNSAADIHLHPSGNFLFVSNRGHNSIATFRVNSETGMLKTLSFTDTRGSTPRNFSISPDGKFLYVANQDSDNITMFSIDTISGNLDFTDKDFNIMTPVSIEFLNKGF